MDEKQSVSAFHVAMVLKHKKRLANSTMRLYLPLLHLQKEASGFNTKRKYNWFSIDE